MLARSFTLCPPFELLLYILLQLFLVQLELFDVHAHQVVHIDVLRIEFVIGVLLYLLDYPVYLRSEPADVRRQDEGEQLLRNALLVIAPDICETLLRLHEVGLFLHH